jgi:REP element-mobilizing transposase RayT
MEALCIGGIEDHGHLLIGMPPTILVCEAIKKLKGRSSSWINREFTMIRNFHWQEGYAAFSVSKSPIPDVIQYIRN